MSLLVALISSLVVFALVEYLDARPSGEPFFARYAAWVADMLGGDLGESSLQRTSVASILAVRVWPTVLLMGCSLVLTVVLAVPLGAYLATRRHGAADVAGRAFSYLGYSLPDFWLGAVLQLVLGVYLTVWSGTRIFYTSGFGEPGGGLLGLAQHLALPVATLSAASLAQFVRFQRGAMLEALTQDYVRTARAKGVSLRSVYYKHALRNALVPTATLLALSMGAVSGGAVVVETVFAWPGAGYLLVNSIFGGDYEVVRALLMINAVLVISFNLIADLLYALLDPRLERDGG